MTDNSHSSVRDPTGGWQCPYCQEWVVPHMVHACPGAATPDAPDYVLTFCSSEVQILAELKALNEKLTEILDVLTKIWREG